MTNKPFLLETWNFIAQNPERHDQYQWARFGGATLERYAAQYSDDSDSHLVVDPSKQEVKCGTVACVAGWTCALAGDKFLYDQNLGTAQALTSLETGESLIRPVEGRAIDLLDITWIAGERLFAGSNDRHLLRAMIVDLLNDVDIARVDYEDPKYGLEGEFDGGEWYSDADDSDEVLDQIVFDPEKGLYV